MLKRIVKYSLVSLSVLIFFSCDKNNEDKAEERRLGKGTLSFFMNGELWQNSEEPSSSSSLNGTVDPSFSVFGYPSIELKHTRRLVAKQWGKSKFYCALINKRNTEIPYFYDIEESYKPTDIVYDSLDRNHFYLKINNTYYKSLNGSGEFTVTKDGIDYVGTFSGVLYNENNLKDSLVITDGQFFR